MKRTKNLATLAAGIALACLFSACGKKSVAVTGVSLSANSLALMVGQEKTLTVKVLPDNATDQGVTWTSGNASFVTVRDGVVKGIAEGSATITVVTSDGQFTASCLVTVNDYHATGVVLSEVEDFTMERGEERQLSATVVPSNAVNREVTWNASNPDVVRVDQTGKLTALAGGISTISVRTVDGGLTSSVKVTVKVVCKGVAFSEPEVTLGEGRDKTVRLVFTPEDCDEKTVTLKSSDERVVKATQGEDGAILLHGVLDGTATVTAMTQDGGHTAVCRVKVVPGGTVIIDDPGYGEYD